MHVNKCSVHILFECERAGLRENMHSEGSSLTGIAYGWEFILTKLLNLPMNNQHVPFTNN